MQEWLLGLLIPFLQQYPLFGTILMVLGVLRLAMKPLMTLLQTIVDATPYDSDNKWLSDLEASNAYKSLCFLLDWIASIKLPGK